MATSEFEPVEMFTAGIREIIRTLKSKNHKATPTGVTVGANTRSKPAPLLISIDVGCLDDTPLDDRTVDPTNPIHLAHLLKMVEEFAVPVPKAEAFYDPYTVTQYRKQVPNTKIWYEFDCTGPNRAPGPHEVEGEELYQAAQGRGLPDGFVN